MPNKKQKTTLVTEDMLVEAVTARVTEDIQKDIDERFGKFERALEKIVTPHAPIQPTVPANVTSAPPNDSSSMDLVSVTPSHQPMEISHQSNNPPATGNRQQGTATAVETPFQPPHQALRAAVTQPEDHTASAQEVNKNKDDNAWKAWFAAQQRTEHNQASNHRPFNYENDALYDQAIDAQVRHIIEATPHHLKGNLPYDFPYNYVTQGPEQRKLSFNNVTLAEHMYGMFCMIEDNRLDPAIKPDIIEHMKEVAEDACEFEWPG